MGNAPAGEGWRWRPLCRVAYTDGMPEGVAGQSKGLLVKLRPAYASDVGILQHELEHVRLFWLTLGLDWVLGRFKSWRIYDEARAYAVQCAFPAADGECLTEADAAARLSSSVYADLGLTWVEALRHIQKYRNLAGKRAAAAAAG